MNSSSFIVFLLAAIFSNFFFAVQAQTRPSKYASPQLYVFGGSDGKILSSASHFNSSTGEWERTTSMSIAKRSVCGAVVGTKIYFFGGETATESLDMAEIYDCETGSYSQFRSMSGPRFDCGAAVLGGFIYVAGGNDNSTGLSSVIRYDIQTSRRQNVSPMHNARKGLQLVELRGRLYAIGGGGGIKIVEAYNATTDRWTTVTHTNYEHAYFGATVHEGKIYVCSENGFESYSPQTDEWESLPPLDNKYGKSLVSMNGILWALGGGNSKSVHTYNPSTKKWSQRADMNAARQYFTAFVVNH